MQLSPFWRAYWRMVGSEARARLEHRADFALMILGVTATSLSTAATMYFMLGASGTVAGWHRGELIFMQGFMFCIFAPQSACYNGMFWLEHWLKTGAFLRFYTRPANPLLLLALERFHPQGFVVLAIGLAYSLFGLWGSPLLSEPLFYLGFVLLLPLSALVLWVINLAAISTCFWIGESDPVFSMSGKLTDMSRYPLDLFPKLATMIFMALPLAGTVWWPCQALLRSANLPLTVLGMAALALICVGLLNGMWQRGMRRYAGAGG
ncbi:ABC-2 family transporter protein [Deefgea piscis]|uniref:ABC-2 family transporter protein n=1 Tax=Deefgea piscis TaxID=2739061 RepID=UPI001C80CADC|nr:ABC-2 family transporter protein [Deefgea piscis]QZA80927.1 ABC transporter permease [Deefgea piscis]